MWIEYNPNPLRKSVGDCVIRALTKAVGREDWDTTFISLSLKAYELKDMPSANDVWGSYLRDRGFRRYSIPNTCPDCYTIRDFTNDNPIGLFVLATGTHVVTVIDGNHYDAWNSENEVPIYYWAKEEI